MHAAAALVHAQNLTDAHLYLSGSCWFHDHAVQPWGQLPVLCLLQTSNYTRAVH